MATRGADAARSLIQTVRATTTGCELTLTHELHPDWADYTERTRDAWGKMLVVLVTELA